MKPRPTADRTGRLLIGALLATAPVFWLLERASEAQEKPEPPPLSSIPSIPGVAPQAPPAAREAPPGSPPTPDSSPVDAQRSAPANTPTPPPPVDIFAVRSWAPPPPVAPPIDVKPAPPPRPQAPPLPFRFLGKLDEPGRKLAFLLAKGNRVVSVSVGEVIDGTYLVEKHEGTQLYFIYKPLKIRQSISVGHES